jgi:tryptophanyl-tRNA synthetase
MNNMKRVYSGIRATGRLHLGNYFGAVKGMLALQDKYDCVFSVVDLHTITVPYDPKTLKQSVRDIILDYLAAGLDPKKCHLEIQSMVPQHTELAYLLSTIYQVSRLEDLPTYKEKKVQYPKYVNMGLLYYPVLMAADILLYKAELVPAGADQEPHIEVTREIARKFNSMFGDTFPRTQRFETSGQYVPSLSGEGKMSKSVDGSYINLTDDFETIKRKVAKIPTDSGIKSVSQPLSERGGPMFGVLPFVELFQGKEKKEEYERQYISTGIKYASLKQELAEAIFKELQPIQEKRKEFESNPKMVDEIIEKSVEECRQMAEATMKEVKEKMGLTK